ncbi:hypothetical protein [Halorientalis sp.]|uniref:hypothetical protein n=1 Tax=Halorientalis sp. TaxID=1931229 RepID=UPI002625C92D|nr:hypothetical protein [Halorientalis sp.]
MRERLQPAIEAVSDAVSVGAVVGRFSGHSRTRYVGNNEAVDEPLCRRLRALLTDVFADDPGASKTGPDGGSTRVTPTEREPVRDGRELLVARTEQPMTSGRAMGDDDSPSTGRTHAD